VRDGLGIAVSGAKFPIPPCSGRGIDGGGPWERVKDRGVGMEMEMEMRNRASIRGLAELRLLLYFESCCGWIFTIVVVVSIANFRIGY